MSLEKSEVFMRGPRFAADLRGQEIYPSLSALFSLSFWITKMLVDLIGNFLPLFLTSFGNESFEEIVLVVSPWSLLRLLLVLALPLVVTLVVIPPRHESRNILPIDHCLQIDKIRNTKPQLKSTRVSIQYIFQIYLLSFGIISTSNAYRWSRPTLRGAFPPHSSFSWCTLCGSRIAHLFSSKWNLPLLSR